MAANPTDHVDRAGDSGATSTAVDGRDGARDPAITLHHLERSRSTRVIWLLEAIGLPYTLRSYPRTPEHRAPEDYRALHPLGKSPLLIDGDLVLAESSAILRYLDARYAAGRFSFPPGTPQAALHDHWLDWVEGSLGPWVMIGFMGLLTGGLPPALDAFASPELATNLAYLADAVGGRRHLLDDRLTLADIQLEYTLELAASAGMLADHPAIAAYLASLKEDAGYRAAISRGGPVTLDLG